MLTVSGLLIVLAFLLTLANGITSKVPLWIPVLLICIVMLIGVVVR
jgi:hypothetical protein